MMANVLILLIVAQQPAPVFTSPASDVPELGHGVSSGEAREGWIALFDGETTFGWTDAVADRHVLMRGVTTAAFGDCEIRGTDVARGRIEIGGLSYEVEAGEFKLKIQGRAGKLKLSKGLAVDKLLTKPDGYSRDQDQQRPNPKLRPRPKALGKSLPAMWTIHSGHPVIISGGKTQKNLLRPAASAILTQPDPAPASKLLLYNF